MLEPIASVAAGVRGFLPEDEGLALLAAGRLAAPLGPLLEIGSYCGKSALFLGTAAREHGTVLFTVDHHRGSEEMQQGWEHHDPDVVDARTGRMDTLPFLRRALEAAALEEAVIPIIGDSPTVARYWGTPIALLFIDGGHALDVAEADFRAWSPFLVSGGLLAIHDVFENPSDGGQAPFTVWQEAVAQGFTPVSTTGSLRVLRR